MSRLLSIKGTRTVDSFHRELGLLMWDHCGMSRTEAGLRKALDRIPGLRAEFWRSVRVPGEAAELNQELEKANRVADFLELAELMLLDALLREESCGGHFREEHQTADGEALRDDVHFSYVAAWEYGPQPGAAPRRTDLRPRSPHPAELHVNLTVRIWRQSGPAEPGRMVTYARRRPQPGHVVPGDAGRPQPGADRPGAK